MWPRLSAHFPPSVTQPLGAGLAHPVGLGWRGGIKRDFRAEKNVREGHSERRRKELRRGAPPTNLSLLFQEARLGSITQTDPSTPCPRPRRFTECVFAFPLILFKEITHKLLNSAWCAGESINVERQRQAKAWLCKQLVVWCWAMGLRAWVIGFLVGQMVKVLSISWVPRTSKNV